MAQRKIEELRATFRRKDRAELEELALAQSMAHARICELASYHPSHPSGQEEERRHATEGEMRDRIRSKSTDELADLLADSALLIETAKP